MKHPGVASSYQTQTILISFSCFVYPSTCIKLIVMLSATSSQFVFVEQDKNVGAIKCSKLIAQ